MKCLYHTTKFAFTKTRLRLYNIKLY